MVRVGWRAIVMAAAMGWCAGASALFDEDGACQDASAQIKSARADLDTALQAYRGCLDSGKGEACEAEFAKVRDAQSAYREAAEHRQQACSY